MELRKRNGKSCRFRVFEAGFGCGERWKIPVRCSGSGLGRMARWSLGIQAHVTTLPSRVSLAQALVVALHRFVWLTRASYFCWEETEPLGDY
jgi:hypothetical protein